MKRPATWTGMLAAASFLVACPGTEGAGSGQGQGGSGTGSGDGATGSSGGPQAAGFYDQVAPIFVKACDGCHQPGGIAPSSFLTWEDAKPFAGAIKQKTAAREMPPYPGNDSGECHTFKDGRWLSDAELATIAAWADGGALEGDKSKAPAMPGPPPGITNPSKTLQIPTPFTPSGGSDEYRCFVFDLGLSKDTFVTEYEVVPDQKQEVHHAILYALDTAADDAAVKALEAQSGGEGYECLGGVGANASPVALWAPGVAVTSYPAATGLQLKAGRLAVLQIHYNLLNGATPDRTKLNLLFADKVDKPGRWISVADPKALDLPPRLPDVTATASLVIPAKSAPNGVELWGHAPHMHTRGRKEEVVTADQCLLNVDRWNFHWQMFYEYDSGPVHLAPGARVDVTCHYDTMAETADVHWGEKTTDEMCIDYLYVTASP